MGSSSWWYVTDYHRDLAVALRNLHQRVLADHRYYLSRFPDEPWPETMEELWSRPGVEYGGTHSILDVSTVIGPDDPDDYATVRPLRPDELLAWFGTVAPTLADLEARENELADHGERGSGFAAVAHDAAGEPEHLVFFGRSGD